MDLQAIKGIDLFKNLDAIHIAHIASIMQEREAKKGTVIFDEGDASEEFFVISAGRVRISKILPGMGEEALAILDTGTYFGEMELIDPMPRIARAIAHEDCMLQVFRYEDFHTLIRTDNELALAMLWSFVRTLSKRLNEADNKVAATFAMAQFQ